MSLAKASPGRRPNVLVQEPCNLNTLTAFELSLKVFEKASGANMSEISRQHSILSMFFKEAKLTVKGGGSLPEQTPLHIR